MPLLWFRIASVGSGPERYTLQVPFQLGPTHNLTPADVKSVTFGDYTLELNENQGIHLLRITGFHATEEAEAFLPRLRGSLLRLTVSEKVSVRSTGVMQAAKIRELPVDIRDNPNFGNIIEEVGWTHLDGFVDHSPAVVIPEHLRIMELGAGSMTITHGMPEPAFLSHIVEGLLLPYPERVAENNKLSLAIDLYAASLWELSQRAKVVGLATSLESLIDQENESNIVLEHVDQIIKSFKMIRSGSRAHNDQCRELDSLESRLANLKKKSISETFRQLAMTHAEVIGETPQQARKSATVAYGVRSKLLHEGYATEDEIADAVTWLNKAVPAILKTLVDEATNPSE